MSDPNWNHLPDELKQLGQKPPETPANPAAFKERVLQEYERRTRYHLRARWMRRAMTAAAVSCAVLVGVLVAQPEKWEGLLHALTPSQPPTAAQDSAFTGLTKQEVVEKFFDLQLQKRPTEAQGLLAKKLQGKPAVFGVNRTNPHLTGYRLLPSKDVDGHFQVTLNWANYETEARIETLEVALTQENGRWVIGEIQELQTQTYQTQNQTGLVTSLTRPGENAQTVSAVTLPPAGKWGFLAADPANPSLVALAQQGARPQVYVSDGKQARLLATLPEGEIGEMLWGENGLLVVNFSPKQNLKSQELWFVDSKSGATHQDEWMVMQQKDLRTPQLTAVHMLSGNRLRLRVGVNSYIADLERKTMTKEDLRPPQIEEVVYDATDQADLPDDALSFLPPAEAQNWLRRTDIPSEKRIDPAREIGYYLLNGSVQSITLVGSDLQVEVSADPGRLQVVRIPFTRLAGMSGKTFTFHVYNEAGISVLPSQTVQVP